MTMSLDDGLDTAVPGLFDSEIYLFTSSHLPSLEGCSKVQSFAAAYD